MAAARITGAGRDEEQEKKGAAHKSEIKVTK
jgi:hypothetical protein